MKKEYISKRILILLLFLAGIDYAQITITLPNVSVTKCDTVLYAPVIINDITGKGIFSFQFQIAYNPRTIEILGINTEGTILDNSFLTSLTDTVNGAIRVAWASAEELKGKGTLLNLKIKTIEKGKSKIEYVEKSRMQNGEAFESIFGKGEFTISAINGNIKIEGNGKEE